MKAHCLRMLNEAKMRAYRQIDFALHHLASKGNFGSTFNWWDADHQKHETLAHYKQFYDFRLGDRQGEEDIPLFYNHNLRDWDSVLNMPVDDLCACADYFIQDIAYRKTATH